jgi:23S rRNA pseudouridine955/2504/2580 synthase
MIEKSYIAGVYGKMHNIDGIQKAFLYKDSNNSLVTTSDTPKEGYKEILTEIHIRKNYDNFTLLDITLHTGKTHQIRAHLSHLGFPIVGDNKYGDLESPFKQYKGYFLTSAKLKFNVDDEMSYLNSIVFEITPKWIDLFDTLNDSN